MAKFKAGDKAFIMENNNRIREVEVRSASGGMYLIKFPETGGGIKLKESRLFATKEEAQKSVYGYRPKTPYDYLELMPGAKEMFDLVYNRYGDKCEILTGIPKPKRGIETAGEDKTTWTHRLLAKDIKVNIVFREEKPQYCTGSGCILIDDMQRNIRDWNAMGGTGIVYVSAEETIGKLKEMRVL